AVAFAGSVRRHGNRSGDRATHRPSTRRTSLGRRHDRQRRHVLCRIAENCKGELMNGLKRILLVEDDPKDVELTLTGLAEYNLANEVVVARDGEEALEFLFQRGKYADRPNGNPAVMLLDLKLPKVNGFEVLEKVRVDENLKMLPVVVLTSSNEE